MKNIRCKRTVTLMYIYEWHFQVEFIHQTQIICPNGKKPTDLWKWKIRFQKDDAALDWCSDMSNLRKMTIAICHKQNEREKGVLIILFVSSCFGNNFSWIHQHDIHVHEMCLTFTEVFSSTKWFEAAIAIYLHLQGEN